MKLLLILLFSLLWVVEPRAAFAAACCGGGFSAPSIIAGDDKAQLSTTYSFSQVAVDNVDSRGIWKEWNQHQQVQNYKIEGAHILSDRWQAGLSVPIVQRSYLGKSYSGLADVSSSVGFEYLPDWDYNPFRPKGIGYLQLTLPTGKSKAESELGGLDSRGNGFWAIGIGTLLSKSYGMWDGFISIEGHQSFEKSVNNSQIQGILEPGYGGNLGTGVGFNLQSWRLGVSLTWTYEDPIKILGALNSEDGFLERYATSTVALSFMASNEWSGTISYSDQTLFGSPINTSLGRTGALQIQRRWGR